MNFSKALTEITSALDTSIEAMTLKYTTSNFKSWKEKFLANVKKKITELKKQNLNKQNQYCVTQMLKSIWKNFTENLILSLLIKPQVVQHLYVENTTFPNQWKFLERKIKIQHQNIHKQKFLWRSLLKLTSETAKKL